MIPPFLPFLGAAAAVGGIAALALYRDAQRRKALEEFCMTRGYRFEPKREGVAAGAVAGFPIFRKGYSHRWGATISGRMGGRDFTAFEYAYVTGGGNSRNRHRIAGMLWESDTAHLPPFTCVPENALYRLGQILGMQDFDFDDDPEFSTAYQLQGQDEAAVRAFFTRGRRAFLTAPGIDGGRRPRHHVAGSGTQLLWWRNGRLPTADDLDQFLAEGDRLRRAFLDTND
jgi:hypothetical protein